MSFEPDLLEQPRVSVWKRLLALSAGLVAALVALGVGNWVYQGNRTQARLNDIIAELDAHESPWRLEDLEVARPVVADVRNSARVVVLVDKILPRDWPKQEFDERLQEVFPPDLLDPERRKMLAEAMKAVAPALVEARKMARMPDGRHQLVLAPNPINTLLKDQQDTRKAAALSRYDAWDRALDGDMSGALLAARAGVNAGRSLDEEMFVISQFIRKACIDIALNGLERSLALGEASEADLAEVQQLLALEAKHPTLLICMRGERAMVHAVFDRMDSGVIPKTEFIGEGWAERGLTWRERIIGISRADLRRQQCLALELMTQLVETARLPSHEQRAAEQRVVADIETTVRDTRARLVAMLLPSKTSASNAFRRKLAQVQCMRALLAVERYRVTKGKWPDKLDDLGPLLPEVPLDPFDGKPLRYKRVADGVIVYAVGEDGLANGGSLDRVRVIGLGKDLGYQLWDVAKRRQPAKPPKKPEDDAGP